MRTHLLIDQLAELAGQRNHDRLDHCFVALFEDLLAPQSVQILRPDEGEDRRWPQGDIVETAGTPHITLVPMGSDDESVFLIELRTERTLSDEQRRAITGVQRFYRHLRNLMDENERDSLTRLLNRKSFDETFVRMALRMEDEEALAEVDAAAERRHRLPASCWLGVVDIDHFKAVNDTHGHLIGDEVLILVAQLMRQNFRRHDRLYRFGGEEFVVLLRCSGADEATLAFERLRHTVEHHEFPRIGRLTVSVGYTEVQDSDTPSAAFERADQAVYHAKNHGRNMAACFDALATSGDVESKAQATEVEFF